MTILTFLRQFPEVLQLIGILGFSLYIFTFSLLQAGKICGNSTRYACCIVVAASCVLLSLVTAFNLPAFLIQSSYIAIGLFGIVRRWLGRRVSVEHVPDLLELRDQRRAVSRELARG